MERLTDGDRARRAGVGIADGGAVDPKIDRHVARTRASEDRGCERGRYTARPAGQVVRVLLLAESDAAQR